MTEKQNVELASTVGNRLGQRPRYVQRADTVCRGATPVWVAGALALLLLVGAGVTYRIMAAGVKNVVGTPLPVPLHKVPRQVAGWIGQDVNLPPSIVDYMRRYFADDYLNRDYRSAARRLQVGVYVVYCSSRPSGILGHNPTVCYPGSGWIHDQTVLSDISSRSGRAIKCLIHQFHKPIPSYQSITVLNFYILNGHTTARENDFSGFGDRLPNVAGDPARYVAQVQISSLTESAVRAAAADLVDTILLFLPDQQGHVGATTLVDAADAAPAGPGEGP